MKKNTQLSIITSIGMLIVSLIMLFPFVLMAVTSLKTMGEIQSPTFSFIPKEWLFENFAIAMSRGDWLQYFYNSFFVTLCTVIISLLFNSMAGFAFARLRFPGRDVLFFSILIGIMVPAQTTMIPTFLMLKLFPFFGGNDWLGHGGTGFINTYAGLILPFVAGPFGIFLCRQYFMNFPRALDEAAQIDGASIYRVFYQIYLPLSKPILATLAIFKTTATWNDYMWPLIMTNTEQMRTVQLGLTIFRSETNVEWNLLMAATTLVVLPLVLLFLLAQKYFVQGIVTTGLK
ncbi:carbohydrate ABC transporter permease [Paenibacillus sp. GCM10023248]|uniref:carbohydrate ABC transporter permease n=1 Tax=Bacillales TaxID=1385 RepID=UPI00237933CB|nr:MULTISPECIES: carbohydrate ABC transporter permease [Bacillales]MDD9268203.1 carbohydrate ABC transporter permease [Paenibacillus sp. MAHUQ-63]MDR6879882.1 multiple sugar transport system permease protein [Bacillus sp. 3255]